MTLEGQVDTGRTTHLPQMHRQVPWKTWVRVATTANGTFASAFDNGSTVDGVALATGDRILVKNQTATEQNGIYVVQASGEPFRAFDMDDVGEVEGAVVLVLAGTANAGTLWYTTSTPSVLDDDAIVFAQFSSGGISGIGAKEGGSTIVASATALDFGNGLDVSSPGGGVAGVVVDPLEIKLDDLGTPDDNTDLNATTTYHGLLKKLGGGTVNFLRADGTWADPSVPASGGSSFNEMIYGPGMDGDVTISVDTSLTRDMYYHNLTIDSGKVLTTAGWRVFVSGTLTINGTIANNAPAAPNAGNGTGAAGGAAGLAGNSTSSNNLGRGGQGVAGRIGGFNAAGGSGTAGQTAGMFRADGTAIVHGASGNGGAGANAGGTGNAGTTGSNTLDAKPVAAQSAIDWKEQGTGNSVDMNGVHGRAPGGAGGGGSATGGGGGGGGSGAGGGPIVLVAKTWSGAGNVEAKGGAGGNGGNGFATTGNNGGGGGGSGGAGGAIVQVYSDKSGWSGSLVVTGGAKGVHGNGNGGGANGTDGSDGPSGYTFVYRIS